MLEREAKGRDEHGEFKCIDFSMLLFGFVPDRHADSRKIIIKSSEASRLPPPRGKGLTV